MKRAATAVMVDGPNLLVAAALHLPPPHRVDFARLLSAVLLPEEEPVLKRVYLAVQKKGDFLLRLAGALRHAGWETRLLPVALRGEEVVEKEVDVSLAVDLVLLRGVERVVLVSGDGDLAYPVRLLEEQGVRVAVAQFQDVISLRLARAASAVRLLAPEAVALSPAL